MFYSRPRFAPGLLSLAVSSVVVLSCDELPTEANADSPWDIVPLLPEPGGVEEGGGDGTNPPASATGGGGIGAQPPNSGDVVDVVDVVPAPSAPASSDSTGDGAVDVEVQVTQDCARTQVEAVDKTMARPADIIFAIDTSGSMLDEAAFVQDVMNDFSQQIAASGIDVRVILIANPATASADTGGGMMGGGMMGGDMTGDETTGEAGSTGEDEPAPPPMMGGPGGFGAGFGGGFGGGFVPFGMCIAPPLGSGNCPDDTNLPTYLHVDQQVNSDDALNVIIDTFDRWREQLRPDATKAFVIVSDDNARSAPYDNAQAFLDGLRALSPELFEEISFNGIFGMRECEDIVRLGEVYRQLVEQTGGVAGELCDQDFQPVFDRLAEEIITTAGAEIACEWDFPAPPDGQTFSVDLVEVRRISVGSEATTLTRVEHEGECAEAAWYFDDPRSPTKILACPQTCETIQDDSGGRIDVVFGCEVIDGCAASGAEDISAGDTGSCQWPLPAAPDGTVLDTESVNVRYANSVGVSVLLGNISGAEECANVEGGWYYDDVETPTAIVVCPDTCTLLQEGGGSNVQALFGCETKPALPIDVK